MGKGFEIRTINIQAMANLHYIKAVYRRLSY
jgi:hypothetical protein